MENNIIDFHCKHCGHDKGLKKENALMIYSECLNCHNPTVIESKNKVDCDHRPLNIPKCPTCGSTNLKKISATSKAVNTIAFGLLGTKRHKTFHCNNCGYTW